MVNLIEALALELISIGPEALWLFLTPELAPRQRLLTVRRGSVVTFEAI